MTVKRMSGKPRRSLTINTFRVLSILLAAVTLAGLLPSSDRQAAAFQPQPAPSATQTTETTVADSALRQIQALLVEKESRTPALRKLDSRLVYALKLHRGQEIAPGVQTLEVGIAPDNKGAVAVDMKATVRGPLIESLASLGVDIIRVMPDYDSVRARVPIDQLEAVASLPQVRFIRPQQKAITSSMMTMPAPPVQARRSRLREYLTSTLSGSSQQIIPSV